MNFSNIKAQGKGGLLYSDYNKDETFLIFHENLISNVSSKEFMIVFENCKNILIQNNSFLNNQGNIFYFEASQAAVSYANIENIICFFDSGCLFNLQKKSSIMIKQGLIKNISNHIEGGICSISFSEMTIENMSISDMKSFKYGGFVLMISSFLNISFSSITNFINGGIYSQESILYIENSNFIAKDSLEKTLDSFCSSTLCLTNSIFLRLNQIIFYGNKNSTNLGAVNIFIVLLNFKIFIQAIFLQNKIIQQKIFLISNCFFHQNEANEKGGAIYIENTQINISNCIFKENQAKEGGAIYLNSESIHNNIILIIYRIKYTWNFY